MSLLDQLKKTNSEKNVAGKHPLLKMDVGRNVRDAYFQGIVLAAFVDDNKVDEEERSYLTRMGVALGLPKEDVAENIGYVAEVMKDEQAQGALASEITAAVKSPAVAKLFLAEFSLIWTSHAANMEALREWRRVLVGRGLLGLELTEDWLDALDVAISNTPQRDNSIAKLKDLDKDTLVYLFGPIAENTRKVSQKNLKEEPITTSGAIANMSQLTKEVVDIVLKRSRWDEEYDIEQIIKLAKRAGVHEHIPSTILKLLLPKARMVFKQFCDDIPNIDFSRDSSESVVETGDSKYGIRLLSYFVLFNSLTTLSSNYDVFGKGTTVLAGSKWDRREYDINTIDTENSKAVSTRFSWKWRSNNGEREGRRSIKKLYERILAEFEFRSTF